MLIPAAQERSPFIGDKSRKPARLVITVGRTDHPLPGGAHGGFGIGARNILLEEMLPTQADGLTIAGTQFSTERAFEKRTLWIIELVEHADIFGMIGHSHEIQWPLAPHLKPEVGNGLATREAV